MEPVADWRGAAFGAAYGVGVGLMQDDAFRSAAVVNDIILDRGSVVNCMKME